jgi:hypothetical protein
MRGHVVLILRRNRRTLLSLGLGLIVSFGFNPAEASSEKVYWGGVGFVSYDNRDKLFPNLSRLLCKSGTNCPDGNIDVYAKEQLDKVNFQNLSVSTDLIGTDESKGEGVIMAPIIVRESINRQELEVGGGTKQQYLFRVFANLTFFEFDTKRFISSRPIIFECAKGYDKPIGPQEEFATFKSMVGSRCGKTNFFELMFQKTKTIKLDDSTDKYVRVNMAEVSDQVGADISGRYAVSDWAPQVSQIFEGYLVEATNAPFIPSVGDENLDVLQTTFTDASFEIKLPPPNIEIIPNVMLFKKFEKLTKHKRGRTVCHAVKVKVSVLWEKKDMLSAAFSRTKDSCDIVRITTKLDSISYFQESLFSLLFGLAKQFGNPNQEYIDKYAGDSSKSGLLPKFKKVKEEAFTY